MRVQDALSPPAPRPDLIYHYCSMDSFSKIIENKELWLTSSVKMNDITEGNWIIAVLRKYVEENLVSSKADIKFANSMLDFISLNSSYIYMTCFSQTGDLLSQWRAYADDCKGISIGFRLNSFSIPIIDNSLYSSYRNDRYYICKVQYLDYNNVYKLLDNIFKNYELTKIDYAEIAINFIRMRAILKNDSFSQEMEWRLALEPTFFRRLDANIWGSQEISLENLKTRITSKGLSTYLTYPILGENQPQIEEVILGPLNQTTDSDLSFFLYKNRLPLVKIRRSRSTFCG